MLGFEILFLEHYRPVLRFGRAMPVVLLTDTGRAFDPLLSRFPRGASDPAVAARPTWEGGFMLTVWSPGDWFLLKVIDSHSSL